MCRQFPWQVATTEVGSPGHWVSRSWIGFRKCKVCFWFEGSGELIPAAQTQKWCTRHNVKIFIMGDKAFLVIKGTRNSIYLRLLKLLPQVKFLFYIGTLYIHTPVYIHKSFSKPLLAPFYLWCTVFWSVSLKKKKKNSFFMHKLIQQPSKQVTALGSEVLVIDLAPF